jgi:hypothetical protein
VDKAAVFRKGLLGAALAGTVYASLMTDDGGPPPAKAAAPQATLQALVSVTRTPPSDDEQGDAENGDPFAPRNWTPPAPPPEPVKVLTSAPPVAEVIVPQGPPPLPYQFMGRMNGSDDQVVYLGRGDQALVARAGEVLESTYKVINIGAAQIEFEHIPTGQRQTLSLQSN